MFTNFTKLILRIFPDQEKSQINKQLEQDEKQNLSKKTKQNKTKQNKNKNHHLRLEKGINSIYNYILWDENK